MSSKILFISSRYAYQSTLSALERIRPNCETMVVCYDHFDQLCSIYDQYQEGFDAVFVTGTSSLHVLQRHIPNGAGS